MGDWDLSGVHGLNKYIWSRLKEELNWKESDYNGLTPITTPQQQPEFNQLDKPYIVYTYSFQGSGLEWWIKREVVMYKVYSASTSQIRSAVNVIKDTLGRLDDSAKDVNEFISDYGSEDNKKFDYKVIFANQATGPEPSISEGGRHDGSIVVTMQYTHYDPEATGDDSIRV